MTVISIQNQKGGSGKSTIALSLSAIASQSGVKTLLLDADKQASVRDWAKNRDINKPIPFDLMGLDVETIHRDLLNFQNNYQLIIIDGPPRISAIARSAILASEFVVIPVQPSPYDVWAAEDVLKLIKEARIYKPLIKANFLINQRIQKSVIGREVEIALKDLGFHNDCGLFATSIHRRVAFAECTAMGLSICEYAPKSTAVEEIKKLYEEVQVWLKS